MRLTFIFLLTCASYLSVAQQYAVTETGKEVVLYDDGTWKYRGNDTIKTEIPTNPKNFTKNSESTFLLKSNKINMGFWINPKKWSFKKATSNEAAEYELKMKEGDLYSMIITENIEIPLDALKSIAYNNSKELVPDLKLVKEEYRTVNGKKVLFMQMNGTIEGIKFSYYGYYYSNSTGTVQFITYTSQNLLDKYLPDCENLLNGLVELK
jgi:hypothetical protein